MVQNRSVVCYALMLHTCLTHTIPAQKVSGVFYLCTEHTLVLQQPCIPPHSYTSPQTPVLSLPLCFSSHTALPLSLCTPCFAHTLPSPCHTLPSSRHNLFSRHTFPFSCHTSTPSSYTCFPLPEPPVQPHHGRPVLSHSCLISEDECFF